MRRWETFRNAFQIVHVNHALVPRPLRAPPPSESMSYGHRSPGMGGFIAQPTVSGRPRSGTRFGTVQCRLAESVTSPNRKGETRASTAHEILYTRRANRCQSSRSPPEWEIEDSCSARLRIATRIHSSWSSHGLGRCLFATIASCSTFCLSWWRHWWRPVLVVTFAARPHRLRCGLGCRQQVRSHLGVVSKHQSLPGSQ